MTARKEPEPFYKEQYRATSVIPDLKHAMSPTKSKNRNKI